MKQIVTIFRAEGKQAARLLRLCRTVRRADFLELRDSLREQARSTDRLTAYAEHLDGWSGGNDFIRIIGQHARRRQAGGCEIYFAALSPAMLVHVKRQARRKHQFAEQATLARTLNDIVTTPAMPVSPMALVLFREVVGCFVTDEEYLHGSNQPLEATRLPRR